MDYDNNNMNDPDREARERAINEFLSDRGEDASGRRKGGKKGRLARIRNTPFRDNLYNYSDVLAVVLIILIAAIFIFWRVGALMSYNAERQTVVTTEDTSVEQIDSGQKLEQALEEDAEEVEQAQNAVETQTFEVWEGMKMTEIVSSLYEAGLIEDEEAFLEDVKQAGAEGLVKVGTYEIPVGASSAEIIAILTE